MNQSIKWFRLRNKMIITDKDFYKNLNLRLVYLLSVIDFTWKSMLRDYFYAISVLLLYKGPWWTKRGWPNETFLTKEPSKITSELFHCSLRSIGQFTHKAHFGKQMYKLKTNSLYVFETKFYLQTNFWMDCAPSYSTSLIPM